MTKSQEGNSRVAVASCFVGATASLYGIKLSQSIQRPGLRRAFATFYALNVCIFGFMGVGVLAFSTLRRKE
jgi:hypothetical protein